ncbi:Glycosyl transferase, family 2 [sediment metagenome]|uniref:Glycosyl transferase, family 2 n=1 Tax=sediment metagenome TaxID=749907 RepID=D9PM15_9ZZZZ
MHEAIDSALSQTYENVEVIVVNDGSADEGATDAIARSYGDRIRYIYKVNGGVASALNEGIKMMSGEYFSWLSHDDLYVPHKVESQIRFLLELDEKSVVLYSDYINVDSNNNDLYAVRMDHALLEKKPLYAVFRGAVHGCTLLVPRKALLDVGMFRRLPTTQDYDLWFRMIRRYKFLHVPEILVRSRLHPEQGSRHIEATEEANELWIRMMAELSPQEILSMEESEGEFFNGMIAFLSQTPYKRALEFARTRAKAVPRHRELLFGDENGTLIWRQYLRKCGISVLNAAGLLPYVKAVRDVFSGKYRRSREISGTSPGCPFERDCRLMSEINKKFLEIISKIGR